MAKTAMCKKVVDFGTDSIVFKFINGEVRTVSRTDFSQDMQLQLVLHGISQKLGDTYSGIKDPEAAIIAFDTALAGLARGEWRSGGGVPKIVRVIARARNITLEAAQTGWEMAGETEAARKKLQAMIRKHPAIKAVEAEMAKEEADRANSDDAIDLDGLGF